MTRPTSEKQKYHINILENRPLILSIRVIWKMVDHPDSFTTPKRALKRKAGRPKGSKNKFSELFDRKHSASVKSKAVRAENRKAWADETLKQMDPFSRTRYQISNPLPYSTPDLTPPERPQRILSEEMIATALRTICFLTKEKDESIVISTDDVFGRAERYLDIGHTKLRELWKDFVSVKGTSLPPSLKSILSRERLKKLGREWFGPLREEIYRIRRVEGRAVEIPTLIKWLHEKHDILVNKQELLYRLHKMGFLFGKMRKLCLRRESDDVTRKRRLYLKKRKDHDQMIEDKKKKREVWLANKCIGPVEPELIYVYLDESYVNRYEI